MSPFILKGDIIIHELMPLDNCDSREVNLAYFLEKYMNSLVIDNPIDLKWKYFIDYNKYNIYEDFCWCS